MIDQEKAEKTALVHTAALSEEMGVELAISGPIEEIDGGFLVGTANLSHRDA